MHSGEPGHESPAPATGMRHLFLPLSSLVLTVALFASESLEVFPQIDDAYISYRYAQNLVSGNGLVFNIGEFVEGYTNLLWTLLIAVGLSLGWSAEATSHWLGFGSGCALLAGCTWYSYLTLPNRAKWLATAAPCVLLASNSFASWTASGLETPLFCALIVWALIAQLNNKPSWVVVLCVLATLTRPDGALIAVVLLSRDIVMATISERRVPTSRAAWSPPLGYGAAVLLLTVFRWTYYGDIVPNTFHAKVGGLSAEVGVRYVWSFLADGPLLLLIPAVFARNGKLCAGLVHLAIVALYIVAIGGDVFSHSRFLLPVFPVVIATSLSGISTLLDRNKMVGVLALACIPLSISWSLWVPSTPYDNISETLSNTRLTMDKRATSRHFNFESDEVTKIYAEHLRSASPPIDLVALIAIGRIGYYSQVTVLDLVGLIDPTIAKSSSGESYSHLHLPGHQRSNADYVFERAPDLIKIPKRGAAVYPLPAFIDLWEDPRLPEFYYWDLSFEAYRRKPAPSL